MRLILTTLVAIVGIATAPLAATFGPLVEADDLANALDTKQPVLLDIRNDGYADSHVDGALWAPYKLFRGTKDNPGGLMDLAVLEEHLREARPRARRAYCHHFRR
jgi:thiosulfate/3-mercaptopyruvate sulfurtransferase